MDANLNIIIVRSQEIKYYNLLFDFRCTLIITVCLIACLCYLFIYQQRLKTDEYEDVETFSHDVCLLFENAIKFYQSDSQEHRDAIKLQDVFVNAKAQLFAQIDEQGNMTFT